MTKHILIVNANFLKQEVRNGKISDRWQQRL